MNGGIHDAINLTTRLAESGRRAAPAELDRYERQRRAITLEHIEKQTIENKRNLECGNPDSPPSCSGRRPTRNARAIICCAWR